MTTYARTNTSGLAWTNTTTAWTPTGAAPTTSADAATFTNTITAANSTTSANATVGQIEVIAPSGAITIAVGGTLTLSPAASFADVGIKFTGTTGQNLTINALLALASSQIWSVTSGRTLTVSNVISGAGSSLTKSDAGTLALVTAVNTFGSGGGQTFTAAAGLTTAGAVNSLGSALNGVVVSSGGAIRFAATPAQTSFSVTGSGNALQPAAIYFNSSAGFASGKTLTLNGNAPTIGLTPTSPNAGVINGTGLTGDVTLLLSGGVGATLGATLSNTQNFTVASGSYLVLRGMTAAGAAAAAEFSLTTTDEGPFGASGNEVKIHSTVGLLNLGAAADVTLSRNYFFEGETSATAPTGTNTYSLKPYATQGTGTFVLQGTVKATAGNWVKTGISGSSGATVIQFGSASGGKLDGSGGAWNIRSFNNLQTLKFHPNLDVSTWNAGAIDAFRVSYGKALSGAATYQTGAVIDNISSSALTLTHSGYTLVGALTFTGSSDMSLGSGAVSASGGAITVSAGTLTVPGTITGTGTFTKAAIGNLTLDGATTGYSGYQHQGGTLTLNNNNALGSSTATLTITAAVANTLDSTLGATLTNTGQTSLGGDFTWGGSANLTFGSGPTSWNAARAISFLNGKSGTLKIIGNIGAVIAANTLSIGGTPAGGSRSRLWIAGTNGMLATTNSVTAGYLKVSNSAGLGNAATTMWTVSSGAALELDGSISPTSARNVTITGRGPDTDGALRSVSGTNVWSGAIIPPVQSLASPTRIQVDAGTFTLDAGSSYPNIAPTVSGTPLQFTALGASAVLNQPRQLTNTVSSVTINNGGVGTVVLSVANNHMGGTTVEGGTCKVTQINATSTGTVQVNATATLESTVQSQFTTLRLGQTGSEARAILKFAA